MKFSSTVIVAALFGALSVTEVEAIAIRQSEAQRLMESIDLDMESLHKKHKKHHKKAKKHHKKSHAQVQTKEDPESAVPAPAEEKEAAAAAGKAATESANKAAAAAEAAGE